MKLNKFPFFLPILFLIISCGGGGGGSGTVTSTGTLTSIEITPASLNIAPGTTGQFTATGKYSDSSTRDITTAVTWSSSDTNIAAISNTAGSKGLATAVDAGTITITASSGSISNTATLTVAMITSFDITPVNPSIGLGATQQFIARGTFSNGATQILTNAANWNSTSQSVATISNTTGSIGLATSYTAGTTTITASWGGVSDSTSLTITPMENVMKVTVNGSLCSAGSYPNKPCVSVTICSPGTANCKTINDILLDTGSVGLRIFKSLVTDIPLTQVTSGAGSLANCITYVDESSHWGPVQIADVILGNEKASNVPIQIIDATFGTPSLCGTPVGTPEDSGYNGILGVGVSNEDCGPSCTSSSIYGYYYSCSGSTCTATTVPLSDQVKNPVSLIPVDNNGFIVRIPAVSSKGAVSVDGILILGIGTRSNNTTSGITVAYPTNSSGDFTTIFNGKIYTDSFMDTGSNGLFFNKNNVSALTTCGDWYCPSSTQNLSATMAGYSVSFMIGNATNLFSSPNNVFIELGGPYTSFDWGLPFFLGRSVYVLIDEKTAAGIGTGPYLAY